MKDLYNVFSFMSFPTPTPSYTLNHWHLSELISPFLSFIDFGAGAPRSERTQLIPGDSELLSHFACPCGHAVVRAVWALDPHAMWLLH